MNKEKKLERRVKKFNPLLQNLSNFLVEKHIPLRTTVKGTSFTDGKKIVISSHHKKGNEKYDLKETELYLEMKTTTIHEVGHVWFSSFKNYAAFNKEISNYFESKHGINKAISKKVFSYMGNCIEDGRIERKIVSKYHGTKKYFQKKYLEYYKESEIDKKSPEMNVFLNSFLLYSLTLKLPINFNEEATDRVKNLIDNFKKTIRLSVMAGTTKESLHLLKTKIKQCEEELVAMMKDESDLQNLMEEFMKNFDMDSFQGEPQNDDTGSGTPIEIPSMKSDKSNQDEEDSEEDNEDESASGSSNNSDDEDDEEESSSGSSDDSNEEGEEDSEEDSSNSSNNSDDEDDEEESSSGSSDDSNEEGEEDSEEDSSNSSNNSDDEDEDKFSDFVDKLNESIEESLEKDERKLDKEEEKLQRQEEKEKRQKKEMEKENISPKDVKEILSITTEYGAENIKVENIETSNVAIREDFRADAKIFSREINDFLKKREQKNMPNRRSGLLNSKSLYKYKMNQFDIFRKKGIPNKLDVAIEILWDNSGSMSSSNKFYHSAKACAVIEEAFKGKIPLRIVAFNYAYRGYASHKVIKSFNQNKNDINYTSGYILNNGPGGGNKDGLNIRTATRELEKRSERKKILIVLSDGLPAEYSSFDAGLKDVKDSVIEAEKKGIEVLSVFFGSESERRENINSFQHMYENALNVSPEDLTRKLSIVLGDLVK